MELAEYNRKHVPSLKCCEGSTKAQTLEDCFCNNPFPHVFLVLTLFLLFKKLLITTALLSETLLPQKDAP